MLETLILTVALFGQTTTCQTVGTIVTCNTQPAPGYTPPINYNIPTTSPGDAFMRGIEDGQRIRAMRDQARQAKRARNAEERRSRLVSAVSQLVAQGDCPGAYRTALVGEDLELAAQVKSLCEISPQ